jgi:hypothetical protein
MRPLAALLLLASCVTHELPPAVLDGSVDACVASCDRMAVHGCLEVAFAARCVPVCHRARAAGLYDPACVAASTDPSLCLGGPQGCRP